MKCLICDRPLKFAKQSECECGESLTFWTAQLNASNALRERGLAQAAHGNYEAASTSFLEAALTHPADQQNLIDAAKALAHCGRHAEAKELLENTDNRYSETKAVVIKAIETLQSKAKEKPLETPPAAPVEEITTPPLEPAITPPQVAPPVNCAPLPPAQPLLGLGVLKRRPRGLKSVLPWAKNNYFPMIWSTVLQLENSWPRDWQTVEPWVHAASETAKETDGATGEAAVFHYMLGLAKVQANDYAAALAAFDRCLALMPPVLNPAAYYLYLHLDNPQNAKAAMDRLEKDYDKAERDEFRRQLFERLTRRGETAKAALLQ